MTLAARRSHEFYTDVMESKDDLHASSVLEFLKLALELADQDHTLYRGQREDWPVRPKLARIPLRDKGMSRSVKA